MAEQGNTGAREPSAPKRRIRWVGASLVLVVGLLAAGLIAVRSLGGAVSSPVVPIADVSSERLLGLGSVVGFAAEHETHAWLGIPFAQPPVGPLRWRAPQDPDAWADTLDALSFGPACLQLGSSLGGIPAEDEDGFAGSEDCLYLNVWAPRAEADSVPTAGDRLPVMVWIHGGGNTRGAASAGLYDGARLAGTQDVVLVSIHYRLGPLGWFSHPALRQSARDALEASGNFGTLDQIKALEWVRDNIAEFGGDPNNVTIFGESAGGTDVLALLLSDAATGLFDRAIAQSGSTDSVSRAEAEEVSRDGERGRLLSSGDAVVSLLVDAGLVPDRDAARRYAEELPAADLADLLRSRSGREILDVYREPGSPDRLAVPDLIRDGVLLPAGDWLEEFRNGRFNRVPLMLGSNRDEMKLFLSQNEEHVRKRFGLLYRIRDPADYARRARGHSDLWALRAVTRPAEAIAASGWRDLFAYRFDWDELPSVLGQDMAELLGAAHGFELAFLFGTFDLGNPVLSRMLFPAETQASREALAAQMMEYWAEFARTGDPGRGSKRDLPEWPRWSSGEAASTLLVLDSAADGGLRVATSALSQALVIAAIDAEASLGQAEKCEIFYDLLADRPDWNPEAFRGIGRQGCASYTPAASGPSALLR